SAARRRHRAGPGRPFESGRPGAVRRAGDPPGGDDRVPAGFPPDHVVHDRGDAAGAAAQAVRAATRNSAPAWRSTEKPALIARLAITTATVRSGQRLPVPNTPTEASRTARLPMSSLRLHSQTGRMFASPSRQA